MNTKLSVLGVRGALPAANSQFMEYGGNTSCMLLECGDEALCFDAGSGFADLCASYSGAARLHVLISHLHIDHIMGLYLLSASCVPEIHLYGGGESFMGQLDNALSRPYWPLALCEPKRIAIHEVDADESFFLHGSDRIRVSTLRGNHPGHCLLYRADVNGTRVTHALDCEMGGDTFSRLTEFSRESDLLIWDANFTDADKQPGWGHSTWQEGIALGRAAGAKKILMTHYSRDYTDSFLREQELLAGKEHDACIFAREGMVIEL